MPVRICAACDSDKTYITKQGWKQWRNLDGHWLCKQCYNKYLDNPISSVKWNPIKNKRMLRFRGKHILLKSNPRTGICSKCGAVKGIDCKITVMHHEEYHTEDPLKDTIELCASCHTKHHWDTK